MTPADYHKEREARFTSWTHKKDHLFKQIMSDVITDPRERLSIASMMGRLAAGIQLTEKQDETLTRLFEKYCGEAA